MKAELALMRKKGGALVPADNDAVALLAKMKDGAQAFVRIDRSRSVPQNALYWRVLEHVAAATAFETKERLHVALKARLGLYDLCRLPNGKTVPVVSSTSFEHMSQSEFQQYMEKALNVLCEEVLGGMAKDALISEVTMERAA